MLAESVAISGEDLLLILVLLIAIAVVAVAALAALVYLGAWIATSATSANSRDDHRRRLLISPLRWVLSTVASLALSFALADWFFPAGAVAAPLLGAAAVLTGRGSPLHGPRIGPPGS